MLTRVRSSIVVAAVCAGLLFAAPAQSNAQISQLFAGNQLTIPVVGPVTGGGSFVGTFNLQRFQRVGNAVVAVGTLVGTLTDAAGVVTAIVRNIVLPVLVTQAVCEILHLELGPLDLNLLGLQVNLSAIVLDIVAQTGSGNLLGNLLCTVTGLLDAGALARLLNTLLAVLG